jgi:hypothetical protein
LPRRDPCTPCDGVGDEGIASAAILKPGDSLRVAIPGLDDIQPEVIRGGQQLLGLGRVTPGKRYLPSQGRIDPFHGVLEDHRAQPRNSLVRLEP